MKINKFNEDVNPLEQELESQIYDIISYEVEIIPVRYSDDLEISSKSIGVASKKIIEHLKKHSLILALDAKKYNL